MKVTVYPRNAQLLPTVYTDVVEVCYAENWSIQIIQKDFSGMNVINILCNDTFKSITLEEEVDETGLVRNGCSWLSAL